MPALVPLFVIGVVLLMLGAWGRRNAADLAVVPGMEPDRIGHREKVLRRGSVACSVVGVAFLIVSGVSLLFA